MSSILAPSGSRPRYVLECRQNDFGPCPILVSILGQIAAPSARARPPLKHSQHMSADLAEFAASGNVFRDIGFLDIPGGGGPENVTYKPPRQFGVTFGFNF